MYYVIRVRSIDDTCDETVGEEITSLPTEVACHAYILFHDLQDNYTTLYMVLSQHEWDERRGYMFDRFVKVRVSLRETARVFVYRHIDLKDKIDFLALRALAGREFSEMLNLDRYDEDYYNIESNIIMNIPDPSGPQPYYICTIDKGGK